MTLQTVARSVVEISKPEILLYRHSSVLHMKNILHCCFFFCMLLDELRRVNPTYDGIMEFHVINQTMSDSHIT